jgi:hypothetical protein
VASHLPSAILEVPRVFSTFPLAQTTGVVQVTLRNGTLTSNVNFRVLP